MTPRLAGTWLLVVVSASPVAAAAPVDPGTGPDQRIAYYRARAGGTGSYVAWARLGQAYLDRGRMTGREQDRVRAERCLARSLAYQPNLEALRGMAVLRLDQHRFGEALELAAEAAAAAPEDVAT
ncbi:MAG TPA: hypothetical protein VD788_15640, partial [Candidatus Polarisedimenticolaceae bacterium]|nr:hypothetical protein [Candidatus Polarisedimenticolaceae bacterium]